MASKIHVREATIEDISLIVDYWMKSSDTHLIGMGVDLAKLPNKKNLNIALTSALENQKSYALIWEYDGKAIGHSNVNNIVKGKEAFMHIHLWESAQRKQGLGKAFIMKSLPFYFKTWQLKTLFCEPYALNPAPNNVLESLGFSFVKKHTTIPGSINFEQEVNRWKFTKEMFHKLDNHEV